MVFLSQNFLVLLWVLPLFIFLFLYFQYKRSRVLHKFLSQKAFSRWTVNFSMKKKGAHFLIQIGVLLLMVLALARPVLKDKNEEVQNQGVEIILAVDVSRSMLSQDVRPSRLALLKTELSRFLNYFNRSDRIGLMAFAGNSFLLSPLTNDLNLIQSYINSISIDIITSQGTHFKSVFDQARRSFAGGGVEGASQVLIIASDGEDHEVGALKAARDLAESGVRIFVLGFGTHQGGAIKLPSGDTLKDSLGQVVVSQFKEQTLKEFAKIGKGAFYHVFAGSDFSKKLHKDLSALKQSMFEDNIRVSYVEIFPYFLLTALILQVFQWIFQGIFKRKKLLE